MGERFQSPRAAGDPRPLSFERALTSGWISVVDKYKIANSVSSLLEGRCWGRIDRTNGDKAYWAPRSEVTNHRIKLLVERMRMTLVRAVMQAMYFDPVMRPALAQWNQLHRAIVMPLANCGSPLLRTPATLVNSSCASPTHVRGGTHAGSTPATYWPFLWASSRVESRAVH